MSKTKELKTITDIVKDILENSPEARNNDDLLYYKVCDRINPSFMNLSFRTVVLNRKKCSFPPFESFRRSRQKIQATYPELAGNGAVTRVRKKNEEVFRDYARGNV